MKVKVGTRGSPLALAQTNQVVARLREIHPGATFEVVPIKTKGDRITTASQFRAAGKGLFVKEIEDALLRRQVSLAIHSMKDLPSELPKGLVFGAVPARADASDVYIGRLNLRLDELPAGARIGTSSLRRQAILRAIYPKLRFVDLKGNLDTRLAKLRERRGGLDGIIVAAAGLGRLHPEGGIAARPLPRERVVPAAGQGALALEIRESDEAMRALLAPLHDAATALCVTAERELQRRLEGGCQVPLGAHAELGDDGLLTLTACLATVDGRKVLLERQSGSAEDPAAIAEALETVLLSRGAREILDEVRPAAEKKRGERLPKRKR